VYREEMFQQEKWNRIVGVELFFPQGEMSGSDDGELERTSQTKAHRSMQAGQEQNKLLALC
jgi:hypothetical protein